MVNCSCDSTKPTAGPDGGGGGGLAGPDGAGVVFLPQADAVTTLVVLSTPNPAARRANERRDIPFMGPEYPSTFSRSRYFTAVIIVTTH